MISGIIVNTLDCKTKRTPLTEKAKEVKRESDRNRGKTRVIGQVSLDGECCCCIKVCSPADTRFLSPPGLVLQFDLCIKPLRKRGVNFTQCPADYY